ncbi:M23 family metallopeptidase [Nannocystis sp. SCPEA4]|uniref:M23 family metallopeptidase n=1 Tax=Nannocystis sp. SCPEA4 TaxID=2996787 RepID=UPI00226E4816|nr:M23 family metallopeptidase [Nannocystis sp. SCPEA4]
MRSSKNRRMATGRRKTTTRRTAGLRAWLGLQTSGRPALRTTKNRRMTEEQRQKAAKAYVDPVERKTRNRTVALLMLLAVVNLYVFVWREGTSVLELGAPRAAAIVEHDERGHGPLGAFAETPESACNGDPVRIFEGLQDQIHQATTLDKGRTLRLALLELGVAATEIDALEAALRPTIDLGLVAGTGAPLRLASDRHGAILALEIEQSEGRLLQACRNGNGMTVRAIQHPPVSDVVAVHLELGRDADLRAAVVEAGERPELADRIAAALAFEVDLVADARPRDRIDLVIERRFLGKQFHRYGSLLAVRFRGEAGRFVAFRFQTGNGQAAYFDAEGKPIRRTLLRSPLAFHALQPGARAMMPPSVEVVAGRSGALYRRPEGAPVVALGDGVVRNLGEQGDAGLVLELAHEDGTVARYAHLSRIIGDLRPGQPVRQGDLVALAGHSGKTATDRVRLELWREEHGDAAVLDPLLLAAGGDRRPAVVGAPLKGTTLERFKLEITPWQKALRETPG